VTCKFIGRKCVCRRLHIVQTLTSPLSVVVVVVVKERLLLS
jgi:hypothetical protein